MSVRTVTSGQAFRLIEQEWKALHHAARGGPFSTYEWILSWIEVYGADDADLRIVTAWNDGTLIAAVPLAIRRARPSPRLGYAPPTWTMLCADRAGFHDMLMRPGETGAMTAIFEALHRQDGPAFADLTPVRPSEGFAAFLAAARAAGCWVYQRDEIRTVISDLDGGWEAYLGRRSARTRKQIRALERRIARDGGTVLAAATDSPEDLRILEQALDVSARSWKAQNGTDIGSDPRNREFFRKAYARFAQSGAMKVHVLIYDGKPVSSEISLHLGGTAYGLVIDYDAAYAHLSVGRFISDEGMRRAVAAGARTYDALRATHFTTSFGETFDSYQRVRIAVRPTLARGIVQAEASLRFLRRKIRGVRRKVSGRRRAQKTA